MGTRGVKSKSKIGTLADVPIFSDLDKKNQLLEVFRKAIKPPELLDLDDWSDKYRILPQQSSSEFGIWRTSRFPFLRRIMKCLSPSSMAKEVVVVKGCQLGVTEVATNWMLYGADRDPGPYMYCQKTIDSAEEFSKQRLAPNIELCERTRDIIGTGNQTNSASEKGYPGGFIVMGGANSGAFLRSKPIKNAIADEEDSFNADIDGEGSPIGMIRMRMNNFPLRKFLRISTPKYTETSTIYNKGFVRGSEEYYYVPCPHCNPNADRDGTYDVIKWSEDYDNAKGSGYFIQFSRERDTLGEPKWVHLVCTHCGQEIEEHEKTWMLEKGIWMSTKNHEDYEEPVAPYEVGDYGIPSFQISSLYSPLGFKSWGSCVSDFWLYKDSGDKALLQTFVNQILGETYNAAGQDIDFNWLMARKEDYEVPDEVLCITMGVDVQQDRLEAEVLGHGLDGETWSLGYHVLWGNTEWTGDKQGLGPNGKKTCWKQLDELIYSKYTRDDGVQLDIECTFIDAGFLTHIVSNFCRYREVDRVFPTMGMSGWGKGLVFRPKRRHEEYKVYTPYTYVDEMKKRVYGMLRVPEPGRGYCHFPKKDVYDKKYFAGIVSETLKVEKGKMKWDCPDGARNEPLDIRGYALAAFMFYGPNLINRVGEGGFDDVVTETPVIPSIVDNNPRNITVPDTDKPTGTWRTQSKKKVVKKKKTIKRRSRGVY
jgi:phage terminase large subunit GpA-like protein